MIGTGQSRRDRRRGPHQIRARTGTGVMMFLCARTTLRLMNPRNRGRIRAIRVAEGVD